MAKSNFITSAVGFQRGSPGLTQLCGILDAIDYSALLRRLSECREREGVAQGRRGYTPEPLLRAVLSLYLLNLSSLCDLVRRLRDDPGLRRVSGLSRVPHRSTFSKFFRRLANHLDLVAEVGAGLVDRLRQFMPDLGEIIAVDSTDVRTHSNPNRKDTRDPH